MDGELLSGRVWDPIQMIDSMRQLRRLGERSDTQLIFGHDASQWAALPTGNAALG